MKKIVFSTAIITSLFLVSCGDSKKGAATDASSTTKASGYVVNEADWELKNVNTVIPEMPSFSVKLPKDAKLERNPDSSGVLVTFKNGYELAIKYRNLLSTSSLKQEIADSRALDVDSSMKLAAITVLSEDPHGYVYTSQTKDEDGKSLIGKPATHFSYLATDDKGNLLILEDSRMVSMFDNQDELFSEANQKKVYGIISSSAVFNK